MCSSDLICFPVTIHRPVELMEVLIANSSVEGQIVFDPFAGLFQVGVASSKLNRKVIGCEIDENYFNECLKILGANT